MSYRAQYEKWLLEFQDDDKLMAELRALEGDDNEIEDRFYTLLNFGTAGMRGVIGAGTNRMNKYNVRLATQALSEYIQTDAARMERGVVIAYDSRRYSDAFAKEAALVLCANGIKAYLFDALRPVPVLSYAVRKLNATAGIVITASHNAAKYNGYKVYWEDGGQMPPERASEIFTLMKATEYTSCLPMSEEEATANGLLKIVGGEIDDQYIEDIKKLRINPAISREMGDKLKIVYTPLNGSGNVPVRRILSETGYSQVFVVPEQENPDPDFSTVRAPNPEERSAYELALLLQEEVSADLVLGTDPDCDRVGACVRDKFGGVRILTGNQIGCLLLHYILSQSAAAGALPQNAAVVKSIVSTEMACAIADKYGAKVFDVLTGFKFIAEKIAQFEETGEYTFVFGFEESYGYLSGTDVRDKDAVNACMLLAETAAYYKKHGMTLSDALDALYKEYGFYGERVLTNELTGADGLAQMRALMDALRAHPPKAFAGRAVLAVRDYLSGERNENGELTKLTLPPSDVLYFELEDGAWVCIRPSGTEPKVKTYINAVTQSAQDTEELLSVLEKSVRTSLLKWG